MGKGKDTAQGDSHLPQGFTLALSCLPCLNVTLLYSHSFPTLYFVLWKVAGGHSGFEIGLSGATFETTFPSR